MKLYSIVRVDSRVDEVARAPGVLARIRRALGGDPDLGSGKMRAVLEAAVVIEAAKRALAEVGASDAVALVVDDLVLFEDRDRRADDLGDLFLAFMDYAPAIDGDFRMMRLTVEHLAAGVHYVIELQARTEVAKGEPPIRVIVSGRMAALEPKPHESAEAYRQRVEPVVHDRLGLEVAQTSFDSFVARTRDAIARAFPEAHVSIDAPQPTKRDRRRDHQTDQRPDDREYDPHERHYPNPMLPMLGFAMLGAAFMPSFGDSASDFGGGGGGGGDGDGDGGFELEW